MELNQVHRMTSVGVAEYVKSLRLQNPICMQQQSQQAREGIPKTPSKKFQRQVQMEDVTRETETATNAAQIIDGKKRRKKNIK